MNILDIRPSFLPEAGDCLGAIICKLFQYYKLEDYEIIFRRSGQFYFCERPLCDEYDINKLISFGYLNYDDILYECFNIKNIYIYDPSVDKIIFLIEKRTPVVLYTYNAWCPWRNNVGISPHYCLIVGYDVDEKVFYCIDPLFTEKVEAFPFCNLSKKDTMISYYDTSDVSYSINIDTFRKLDFFACENGKKAWDNMENMKNRIENSMRALEISQSNVFSHCLNARTWFFMKTRSLQMKCFFTLLGKKYKNDKFNDIRTILINHYNNMELAWMILLKYKIKGDYSILRRFLNIIEQSIYYEKKVESFFIDIINENAP